MKEPIVIEVWSDVICPWCYIGKRHLEQALESFPDRDLVSLVFRSFQLDANAPVDSGQPVLAMLQDKYNLSPAHAQAMIERVTAVAHQAGLDYHLDQTLVTNTLEAHQLVHLAAETGRANQVLERFYHAHFTEGLDLNKSEVLLRLAVEAGLQPAEALDCLDSGQFADQVVADQRRARDLGVTGVPFFLFNGTIGLSGAQPAATLLQALNRSLGPSLRPSNT